VSAQIEALEDLTPFSTKSFVAVSTNAILAIEANWE
jgi:hypothetical protein